MENKCEEKFRCPHCPEGENEHSAAGRKCPLYRHEEAVIRCKTDESISWAEARRKVGSLNAKPTYASVTDADSARKDKLIEALTANVQNLTEKIEILLKERENYSKIEEEFLNYKERVKKFLKNNNISPTITPVKDRSQPSTPLNQSGMTTPTSSQKQPEQQQFHTELQKQLQNTQKQQKQEPNKPKLGFQVPKNIPKKSTTPMITRQTSKTQQKTPETTDHSGKRGAQSPLADKKKNKNIKHDNEEDDDEYSSEESMDHSSLEQQEENETTPHQEKSPPHLRLKWREYQSLGNMWKGMVAIQDAILIPVDGEPPFTAQMGATSPQCVRPHNDMQIPRSSQNMLSLTNPFPTSTTPQWDPGEGTSRGPVSRNLTATMRTTPPAKASPQPTRSRGQPFILQWNMRGFWTNEAELTRMIWESYNTLIKRNYNIYKSTFTPNARKGHAVMGILKAVPHEMVEIVSQVPAVVVKLFSPIKITLVCIYNHFKSGYHTSTANALETLFQEITPPFLVGGDFNARHFTWDDATNTMGERVAMWAAQNEMVALNDGSKTRFSPIQNQQDTAIDVTFASSTIINRFKWSTLSEPCNSDHIPIFVELDGPCPTVPAVKTWKLMEANWEKYQTEISDELLIIPRPNVRNITTTIFETAKRSIPRTTGNTAPKYAPWWTEEIGSKIKDRKNKWKILKKTNKTDALWSNRNEEFRKARAETRKFIKEMKIKSWEDFASSFNFNTPVSKMWQNFGQITGRKSIRTRRMTIEGKYTDDPHIIANHIADSFQKTFTTDYPPSIQYSPRPSIPANIRIDRNFSINELNAALQKCSGKSSGPDEIPYCMIKNMPPEAKVVLLEMFNDLWKNGEYPQEWKTSKIIPIPKQGGGPEEVENLRPIALTSCLGKVYERLINRRLQQHLETEKLLHPNQHAFRSGMGTTSYLSNLKDVLTEHRHEKLHSEIVSLDLAKAFDRTWRPGILKALEKAKVGNRIYQVVSNFLKNRSFYVAVAGTHSSIRPQDTGVPQGSVLSPTLFILVMNGIFEYIPRNISVLIYADDILLVVGSKFIAVCRKKLQFGIDCILKWADKNGFTINARKSTLLHMCSGTRGKRHRFYQQKQLTANGTEIKRTRSAKILGVEINQAANANTHIRTLKKECARRTRFLQVLTSLGSRETLLKVGFATIISRLFYGWEIFEPHEIFELETVYNNFLRTVSGAFCTSPVESLYTETGVLPFKSLVTLNWAQKATWIAERKYESENFLLNRANSLFEEITNQRLPHILKLASETTRNWDEKPPKIDWSFKRQFKAGGNCDRAVAIFRSMKSNKYLHMGECYSDGSLANGKIGFGVFNPSAEDVSMQLPETFSIFSAEAIAIYYAMKDATTQTVLYTDSASVLSALESGTKHPIIQKIQKSCNLDKITFVWIPSHMGISGNEKADNLANIGRESVMLSMGTPKDDALKWIKSKISEQHSRIWRRNRTNKLREIKSTTGKWIDVTNKKDQRILTRLRIGHTRMTHDYLLKHEEPPMCGRGC
ncbi:uncharacterized protein LOC129741467 [Uranotaenia lowii]|uniref:uncharacterized protein LOC129741467 n=1 Tax=Uranotaenia lowii TaxID=190385 RepID=UPI00247A0621|nr:uncharacterized protein LOC129741467 [Uranotaenia lowii]